MIYKCLSHIGRCCPFRPVSVYCLGRMRMSVEVVMPKYGLTMQEGTIAAWLADEGSRIEKGDPLFIVETEKVAQEVESPASGILRGILFHAGETVAVGTVIAYVVEPGEYPEVEKLTPAATADKVVRQDVSSAGDEDRSRVSATPVARRIAKEKGVDLAEVKGTGPGGRITHHDVLGFAEQKQKLSPLPAMPEIVDRIPLSGRRKVIAERMQQSARSAPHISLSVDVDMSQAQETRMGCSYTAVVVQALASVLRHHARLNASLEGDEIVFYGQIGIGVAVDTEEGLIVPVLRAADTKSLRGIDREIEDLVERARKSELTFDDVTGGTFTVTNLGMLGVLDFRPIVNPPQAAILGLGAIIDKPVALNGQVIVRPILRMTLSADHRILDGAEAARFLQSIKHRLENPGESS
jgi:pyruvate dehydrogenase E2 component (dihydrolipoamide acetyltransferase)